MKVSIISLTSIFILPLSAQAICSLKSGGSHSGNTFNGPTICTGTVDTVTVHGPLNASDASITSATVYGPVTLIQSKIKNLTVRGSATFKDSKVEELTVFGGTVADGGSVKTIHAQGNLKFTDTDVGTINVAAAPILGSYKVELYGKTVVDGDIIFSKEKGDVIQDSTSQIKGKVVGAKIEKR